MTDNDISLDEVLKAEIFKDFADEALKTTSAAYVIPSDKKNPFAEESSAACQPYFMRIAQVANSWSLFERICDAIIWDMAELNPKKGACLTSQFQSVYTRFKVMTALHMQFNGSNRTAKKLNDAARLCQKISKRRNRVVHDPIAYNVTTKEVMCDRLDEDKSLLRATVPVSLSYYTETDQMINVAIAGLLAIGKTIRMEHMLYVTASSSPNISIRLQPFPPLN